MKDSLYTEFVKIKKSQGRSPKDFDKADFSQWSWFYAGGCFARKTDDAEPPSKTKETQLRSSPDYKLKASQFAYKVDSKTTSTKQRLRFGTVKEQGYPSPHLLISAAAKRVIAELKDYTPPTVI